MNTKNIIYTLTALFVMFVFTNTIVSPVLALDTSTPYGQCWTDRTKPESEGGPGFTKTEAQKACACLTGSNKEGATGSGAGQNPDGGTKSVHQAYCTVGVTKPAGALDNIEAIISGAIQLILIIAGLIAFVYLLLGGIKWITSGGDSAQVEAARNQIIQALVGLIIVFASWGLIVLVERMTGNCLGFTCPLDLPVLY